jgi:hypothetical protein
MDGTLPHSEDSQALLLDVYWTCEMLQPGGGEPCGATRFMSRFGLFTKSRQTR